MKITKITYRIGAENKVYIVHHFENGKTIETFLKKCNTEEEAFAFIKECMK